MWHLIRAIFGAPVQNSDDTTPACLEDGPSVPENIVFPGNFERKQPPLEASQNPEDRSFNDDFNEEFDVVAAKDGCTALLFPSTLFSEKPDGYTEYVWIRPDDFDPRERLDPTIRIYEHLKAQGPLHPRMVDYLGTTNTGYRLERVKYSSVRHDLPCPYSDMNMLVLGLYQRWALQMLSVLEYLHGHNVFMNNVGESIWLREDFSIALPNMTRAGCVEPFIEGFTSNCTDMYSPWSDDYDFASGNVKNDLFDWASWVFSLMTDRWHPLFMHLGIRSAREDPDNKELSLSKDVALGKFDAWPQLDEKMLGSVIVKAWRGEYESVDQAIEDAKDAIRACGHEVSGENQDEIDGYDWRREFEVTLVDGWCLTLRLRSPVPEEE